jgi:hypothetical protein
MLQNRLVRTWLAIYGFYRKWIHLIGPYADKRLWNFDNNITKNPGTKKGIIADFGIR